MNDVFTALHPKLLSSRVDPGNKFLLCRKRTWDAGHKDSVIKFISSASKNFPVDIVINFNKTQYIDMKTVEMKRSKRRAVTVSFRCPEDVYAAAEQQILREDIDFSKLLRRALKREIQQAAA